MIDKNNMISLKFNFLNILIWESSFNFCAIFIWVAKDSPIQKCMSVKICFSYEIVENGYSLIQQGNSDFLTAMK